jgi:hypothetical protein
MQTDVKDLIVFSETHFKAKYPQIWILSPSFLLRRTPFKPPEISDSPVAAVLLCAYALNSVFIRGVSITELSLG